MRRISLGDRVLVTICVTADGKLERVPPSFEATVRDIDFAPRLVNTWQRQHADRCKYKVQVQHPLGFLTWVWKYEIKRLPNVIQA
jgi:hypothetical protein